MDKRWRRVGMPFASTVGQGAIFSPTATRHVSQTRYLNKEDAMKIPDITCLWADENSRMTHEKGALTFREIYEAIHNCDDFNEPQLFYLSRLVERKQKTIEAQSV